MVQLTRGEHLTLNESKVGIDVCVTWLRDELGMTFEVDACLVDPRVQGSVIDVMDLLVWFDMVVKLDGIAKSHAKGVARVEVFHVRLNVGTDLLEVGPLTFPNFDDDVPFGAKVSDFVLGLPGDVLHGAFAETQMGFVTYGIEGRTTFQRQP